MISQPPIQDPSPEQLLEILTPDYEPMQGLSGYWVSISRVPPFRLFFSVDFMLRDPRVEMALSYLKGAVMSLSRFFVDEEDVEIKEFLVQQINRWWLTGAVKMLTAYEWGFSGAEVLYALKDGKIHFDNLKFIRAQDCRAVTLNGSLVGMKVQQGLGLGQSSESRFIGGPKALWHVYRRERHPWYGQSRLLPAYNPWIELTSESGAIDIRSLYFFKHAFSGETLYHPPGKTQTDTGTTVSNKDIARGLIEHVRAGGTYALPAIFDGDGNRMWELDRGGTPGGAAKDVLEYPKQLRNEMAEGIGVPTELIEAAETGSGFSGRKVPQSAFRGMLSDEVYWLIHDFNEQSLIPLVRMNFDVTEPTHTIIPFGLVRGEGEADEGGDITQEGQQVPEEVQGEAQAQNKGQGQFSIAY